MYMQMSTLTGQCSHTDIRTACMRLHSYNWRDTHSHPARLAPPCVCQRSLMLSRHTWFRCNSAPSLI